MKNSLHTRLLLLVIAAAATPPVASALQSQHREFSRTREKELKVVLDVSFGSVTIERGDGENIAEVDYDEEEESKQKLQISYDIENEIGMLRIKLKEPTHFWGSDDSDHDKSRHVTLRLSDAIPVSFDLSLGAGNGQIDLTDLQVKDLKISTGASSVTLKCNKSNSIFADDVTIESGVSKFTATNLGNLNFRNLKFSGGVGSYKLDFGGAFHQSAEAQIELGLGSISVSIPREIPTRLSYDDNWLSSFSLDDDFIKKRNGVYETEDYEDASKRLIVRLESGLGSVKIRRR
jgi:hypothetical protein